MKTFLLLNKEVVVNETLDMITKPLRAKKVSKTLPPYIAKMRISRYLDAKATRLPLAIIIKEGKPTAADLKLFNSWGIPEVRADVVEYRKLIDAIAGIRRGPAAKAEDAKLLKEGARISPRQPLGICIKRGRATKAEEAKYATWTKEQISADFAMYERNLIFHSGGKPSAEEEEAFALRIAAGKKSVRKVKAKKVVPASDVASTEENEEVAVDENGDLVESEDSLTEEEAELDFDGTTEDNDISDNKGRKGGKGNK